MPSQRLFHALFIRITSQTRVKAKFYKAEFHIISYFVKMRTEKDVIVAAFDLYFEGLSVRKARRQLANILRVKATK